MKIKEEELKYSTFSCTCFNSKTILVLHPLTLAISIRNRAISWLKRFHITELIIVYLLRRLLAIQKNYQAPVPTDQARAMQGTKKPMARHQPGGLNGEFTVTIHSNKKTSQTDNSKVTATMKPKS